MSLLPVKNLQEVVNPFSLVLGGRANCFSGQANESGNFGGYNADQLGGINKARGLVGSDHRWPLSPW